MAEYNADLRQDWGAVASLLNWERGLQADKRDQEEQAIRWQGEQDYRTLVDSGVDPMVAFGRTAPKLFHNDPRGLASAVEGAAEGMRRQALEGDPITKTMPDGTVFMRTLNGWTQVHIPVPREDPESYATLTETLPNESVLRSRIPVSEVGKLKADQNSIAQEKALEVQRAMGPGGVKGMWNKIWGNPPAAAPISAPAPAPMAAPTPPQAQAAIQGRFPAPPSTSTAPDAIRNAYRAGKITESEAAKLLKDQHGFK